MVQTRKHCRQPLMVWTQMIGFEWQERKQTFKMMNIVFVNLLIDFWLEGEISLDNKEPSPVSKVLMNSLFLLASVII